MKKKFNYLDSNSATTFLHLITLKSFFKPLKEIYIMTHLTQDLGH